MMGYYGNTADQPSLWIGLGKAGCKLMADVMKAQSNTKERYICIDSDAKDLEVHSPSGAETFKLAVLNH